MTILAIGDVVGPSGLAMVEAHLSALRRLKAPDLTIINGENADMLGLRPEQARRLFQAGADVVTLGNHAWRRREIMPFCEEEPQLLRPANFTQRHPGQGHVVVQTPKGKHVLVVSLVGRCFMDFNVDDPFATVDHLLEAYPADAVVVDIHAEATSEKAALAYHLDGRASVVFGTHTHVQTADEQILPKGLGFITDLGMTGPYQDTVLGVKSAQSVAHFLGGPAQRYEIAPGPCKMEGAVFTLDDSGKCVAVERVSIRD